MLIYMKHKILTLLYCSISISIKAYLWLCTIFLSHNLQLFFICFEFGRLEGQQWTPVSWYFMQIQINRPDSGFEGTCYSTSLYLFKLGSDHIFSVRIGSRCRTLGVPLTYPVH